MYEKIQRLNKRAKQFGLSVIQVSDLIDSDENNSFGSTFNIWNGSNNFINYLFGSYFVWMHLNFYVMDRCTLMRNFMHSSGLVILKIDKNNKNRITWRENVVFQNPEDEAARKTIFEKTQGVFMCLEIVTEIVERFNDILPTLKVTHDIIYEEPETEDAVGSLHLQDSMILPTTNKSKSKVKKYYSRLHSNDDMQFHNKNLVKKSDQVHNDQINKMIH